MVQLEFMHRCIDYFGLWEFSIKRKHVEVLIENDI